MSTLLMDDLELLSRGVKKSAPMRIDKRILCLNSDELKQYFGFDTIKKVYDEHCPDEISSVLDLLNVKVGNICEYEAPDHSSTRFLVTAVDTGIIHGIDSKGRAKIVSLDPHVVHVLPVATEGVDDLLKAVDSVLKIYDRALHNLHLRKEKEKK